MKYSTHLWKMIEPLYRQILELPFNKELAAGLLENKRFIFYMQQDSLYLVYFSKALALIAARSNSSRYIKLFLNFSLEALVAERTLHAQFLPLYEGTQQEQWETQEPSPACLAYTQYLIAKAATAPLEEAVAAILPCFWIYKEVGCQIARSAKKENPYSTWIDTYSSLEFSKATDLAISLVDELAAECSPAQLAIMQRAFEYSSLFEWHFWKDAYEMTVFKKNFAS